MKTFLAALPLGIRSREPQTNRQSAGIRNPPWLHRPCVASASMDAQRPAVVSSALLPTRGGEPCHLAPLKDISPRLGAQWGGGQPLSKGSEQGHSVSKETLVRPWKHSALVRRHTVLQGPRGDGVAVLSREEARQLGPQVIPHLTHLWGQRAQRPVRAGASSTAQCTALGNATWGPRGLPPGSGWPPREPPDLTAPALPSKLGGPSLHG